MTSTRSRLALSGAPAVPAPSFRHYVGASDLPGIAEVINASLAADRISERIAAQGLANLFAHSPHMDSHRDTLLVGVGDALVGYAVTERREENPDTLVHSIDLYLRPEWRGRGIERAMQRRMERQARRVAGAGRQGAQHQLSSKVPETWSARTEMLLAAGYVAVRVFYEMQRPVGDDLPTVSLPAGLDLRPPIPEHYRPIWNANVECDRDNWGHVLPGEERYREWVESPGFDPTLWCVAWDGDQIAGAAINVLHEGAWGETDDLFVRRPWRNRGLGGALLTASLHLFRARGLTRAGLGVDAENPSGALHLYESAGYRPYQIVTSFRKPM